MKLKIANITRVVAVPVLDRQNGLPVAVISQNNPKKEESETMLDVSQFISHTLFTLDSLQGTLANSDLFQSSFDLVSDGVVFLNTD